MASAIIAPIAVKGPGDIDELQRIERELTVRITKFGQASQQFAPVVGVLTIINDSGAWTWHLDENGEQKHRTFKGYVESFGWEQSVPRLYQLMKEFRQNLIDAHEDDPDAPLVDGINYDYVARTRSTGTSYDRFAQTQAKALARFVENFGTAAYNIFESDERRAQAIAMWEALKEATAGLSSTLQSVVDDAQQAKEDAKEARKQERAAEKAALKAAADEAKLNAGDDDDDSDEDDDSLAE